MEFVTNNWPAISAAIVSLLAIAALIAERTENKTDDKIVAFLQKWIVKIDVARARKVVGFVVDLIAKLRGKKK
jgi:hypothetical protein